MILPDTSAWIEWDRATGSPVDRRLTHLIQSNGPLAVTEPVLMEVLAGATTIQREGDLRRLMLRARLLPFKTSIDFEGAADVYRRCRLVGVTPRGLIDCMIATVALRSGAVVLVNDGDFARIASVVGLALDPASLRAS